MLALSLALLDFEIEKVEGWVSEPKLYKKWIFTSRTALQPISTVEWRAIITSCMLCLELILQLLKQYLFTLN